MMAGRFLWALILLLCPIAVLAETQPSKPTAATQPVAAAPTRMAIIDVQRILQESLAARSVQKQLEAQRSKFQAEISGREKQLHEADTALKEMRNSTSGANDAIGEREQQLRQKFMEMERDVQARRHALDEGFSVAMGTVRDALLAVVRDVAKQQNFQVVLLKQQALWAESALDITDEVLTRLNTRLTDVPVKIDLSAATPVSDDPLTPSPNKNKK